MVSVGSVRAKARDARRITDIQAIQKALDMYYLEYNKFPLSGQCGATISNAGWTNSVQCLSSGRWLRDSSSDLSNFISTDPIDPSQKATASWLPADCGTYYYSLNYGGQGQWYMIVFCLEDHSNALQQQDGVTAPNGTYFHYGNGSNGIITVGQNYK